MVYQDNKSACKNSQNPDDWPNPYSAGIDFSRQNLTSVDVRFSRIKTVPALKELKYSDWP